jgi:hypothetical protein
MLVTHGVNHTLSVLPIFDTWELISTYGEKMRHDIYFPSFKKYNQLLFAIFFQNGIH